MTAPFADALLGGWHIISVRFLWNVDACATIWYQWTDKRTEGCQQSSSFSSLRQSYKVFDTGRQANSLRWECEVTPLTINTCTTMQHQASHKDNNTYLNNRPRLFCAGSGQYPLWSMPERDIPCIGLGSLSK